METTDFITERFGVMIRELMYCEAANNFHLKNVIPSPHDRLKCEEYFKSYIFIFIDIFCLLLKYKTAFFLDKNLRYCILILIRIKIIIRNRITRLSVKD